MDERINSAFALTQNNYIAHDLLSASANHCSKYTAEQKEAFLRHLAWVDDCENMDREVLRNIFLGIYANPVDSALRIG